MSFTDTYSENKVEDEINTEMASCCPRSDFEQLVGDICKDNKIDIFDLCIMKQVLI
ncbi:MAG: hypothetical protein NC177_13615 [Ruminococcus flavefaciens]|nr:hypothetical protein [Ruminococcus flavefaciens]